MQNKATIIVVILLVVFAVWYFTRPQIPTEAPTPQSQAVQSIGAGAIDAKSTVSDSVAKTNPFDVKVNPYDGYKNPFAK